MPSFAARLPRPARACVTAAALALAATAGCAPTPEYPVVGERATVERPAAAHGTSWVEVVIEPVGEEAVVVTGGSLFSPLFERVEAVAIDVRVSPGRDARVRLPLGLATCPAGAGPSSAQLVIETAEAELLQSVMLDDAVLGEINAEECRLQDATDAAVPTLGPSGGVDDAVVRTSVVLTRGEALLPVTLDGVTGPEMFAVDAADGDLPARLAGGRARLEVPVEVRVARCDAGAPAGSDKAFVFTVEMTVEGADPTSVELEAPDALREDLRALAAACAATPAGG